MSQVSSNNQQQGPLNKDQLVSLILAYDMTIGNLEIQLKELKKQQVETERKLIEQMEAEEIKSYKDEDGRTVTRDDKMVLTVRSEQKELWFDWVSDLGRGDLIKTDINKNSLNALMKRAIRGEENIQLPEFFDISKDLYFIPRVQIKIGAKSLRKAAAESALEPMTDNF